MSYPPPSGGWQDPYAPQSTPPADPTLPMGAGPLPGQPLPVDPYAGAKIPGDPYAAPGHPPAAGYPPPGYPVAGYAPAPAQNGLAIASMVVSIVAVLGLCGYGIGGYLGIVGLILGYQSRKQIRERGEGGEGFATAGIVIGWITLALAVVATIVFGGLIWMAFQDAPSTSGS